MRAGFLSLGLRELMRAGKYGQLQRFCCLTKLAGRLPDIALEGAGQVRLVRVSGLEGDLTDWGPSTEQERRPACAFDLANGSEGQARRVQKAAL